MYFATDGANVWIFAFLRIFTLSQGCVLFAKPLRGLIPIQIMEVYEASLKYAKERIQFQKPIGSFQLVQEKLVWMLTEISKGQLLAYQVGKNKDAGTVTPQQISMLKRNNTWVARECAKLARELHGANGISGEYPIMRHLMNMESVYTYEGTFDMHTLILGQDITGIPAFR